MLRVYAEHYIGIGKALENFDDRLLFGIGTLNEEMKQTTKDGVFQVLVDHCIQLELRTSGLLFCRAIEQFPETSAEWQVYVAALETEISARLFLYVPTESAKYYENDEFLADETRIKFPKATGEMRAAANCYALSQPTASVFHSMRAAELALRAMAGAFGSSVNFPHGIEVAQWQTVIEQIEKAIAEKEKAMAKGLTKQEEMKFWSDAAVQFRYFKDAWRNHVSHSKETYDEPQALTILLHVKQLLDNLATRFGE
jgi:hypothetical protein